MLLCYRKKMHWRTLRTLFYRFLPHKSHQPYQHSATGFSSMIVVNYVWVVLSRLKYFITEIFPSSFLFQIFTKINFHKYSFILCSILTLNVRGPSYLSLTRSISWLLMPWLLTSPGHQQPWYWLCRIGRFLSYLRKDFSYLRRINVEKWHKM